MGRPPNAPWPGPGAQPPHGANPGPSGGPGWQPGPPGPPPDPPRPPGAPGPYGPPPSGGGGGKAALLIGLIGGGLAVVLIVAVAAFVVIGEDGGEAGGEQIPLRVGKIAGGAEATPLRDGALAMARPGVESPVVDIYADFACPHCGEFDRMHDPMLKELAVAGRAKVVFRPMLVFAESSQPAHDNSLRAASALRCVGDGARWLAYQDALYAHQPASLDTPGYSTGDLISHAAKLGLTGDDFASCVENRRFAQSVREVSQKYVSSGISGTPTVRVNGRTLRSDEIGSPDALRRAIETAS